MNGAYNLAASEDGKKHAAPEQPVFRSEEDRHC
jgi:hypothetical protein